MPERQDVIADRRFWASLYCGGFGQLGEEPDPAAYCALLGVDEQEVLDWHREFTGWYPGIFDKSDGYSDDPATIQLALPNSVRLRIELHPGDQCWFLGGEDGPEAMLALVGGHWVLPGLRWQEAVAMGDALPRDGWIAVLLLLPVVWLTAGDDPRAAHQAAASAWMASHLVEPSSASALAELWVSAVENRDYRWRQTADGWCCDAHWSARSQGRPEVSLLNRLVAAAQGAE